MSLDSHASVTPVARSATSAPLVELLAVLAFLWVTFFIHGTLAEPLAVGGVRFARPDVGELRRGPPRKPTLFADVPTPVAEPLGIARMLTRTAPPAAAAAPPERPRPAPAATSAEAPAQPHRILMIGDSMIEPIQRRAAAYFHQGGHRFISVIWYGSRTIDWGRGERLIETVRTYAPTYVIVVLGSNELTTRNVRRRAPAVRALMAMLERTPTVWIGPPSWREDTGLVALLKEEVGVRFFDSSPLSLERKSDGIHPTDEAGVRWMDEVTAWLGTRPGSERLALPTPDEETRFHAPAKVYPPPGR